MSTNNTCLDSVKIAPKRRLTRPIEISLDGLNDDVFRVVAIEGEEQVSQPYQLSVSIRANDVDIASDEARYILFDLSLRQVLGRWVSLRVNLACDKDRFAAKSDTPFVEGNSPSRYLQGIVAGATMAGPGEYNLTVQNPLMMLSLRNNYKVYSSMSLQELVTELLSPETECFNLNLDFKLEGLTASRVQDWLQAGESDLAFLQRLLSKADVFYYCIHQEQKLTLVFSNQAITAEQVEIPAASTTPLPLRYAYSDISALGNSQNDLFMQLQYQMKLMPKAVRNVLTHIEAEWQDNKVASFNSYHKGEKESDYLCHKYYAYGVNEEECTEQLDELQQQISSGQASLSGVTTSPLLSPGYTFALTALADDNYRPVQVRSQFTDKTFVVKKIQHKFSDLEGYSGQLEAIEVDVDNKKSSTLLSAFDMQGTQQGSIVARVIGNKPPSGWRYRQKTHFDPKQASVTFDDKDQVEQGCQVLFATDEAGSKGHWVRLSQHMQTLPEVGAMVLIGRSSNESELPEISQVMASHGQRCIQPLDKDRRNASWTANTNWGSNYNTSYGGGIRIGYGYIIPEGSEFEKARKLVINAFDHPDMQDRYTQIKSDKHHYKEASFSCGGDYRFSISDREADGVLSASVSVGSSFHESHSKLSYNYSDTETSMHYSQTGKSVSLNVVGEYSGKVDLNKASFIDGKLPESTLFNIADKLKEGDSYQENHQKGRSINVHGVGTSPPEWQEPDIKYISYQNSKTEGNTYSQNHQKGKSIRLEGMGTKPPKFEEPLLDYVSYQNTEIDGGTYNKSYQWGTSTHRNTHIGNSFNFSTQLGANENIVIKAGANIDASIHAGAMVSHNIFTHVKLQAEFGLSLSLTLRESLGPSFILDNKKGKFVDEESQFEARVAGVIARMKKGIDVTM